MGNHRAHAIGLTGEPGAGEGRLHLPCVSCALKSSFGILFCGLLDAHSIWFMKSPASQTGVFVVFTRTNNDLSLL